MEQLIPLLTGPASATVILGIIMWWVANKLTPIFQKYLEEQNDKLGLMVEALEKTVASHEKDREVFKNAITAISSRLEIVEKDVEEIKNTVKIKKGYYTKTTNSDTQMKSETLE